MPPVADAEGLAPSSAVPLGAADGVSSAFRASVTARPWVVALADGEEPSVAFSVALSVALSLPESCSEPSPVALGVGAAPPPASSVAMTGRK
ncbi:hypothetical protein GCM10023238_27830 [Streptomyces heliomycini]